MITRLERVRDQLKAAGTELENISHIEDSIQADRKNPNEDILDGIEALMEASELLDAAIAHINRAIEKGVTG